MTLVERGGRARSVKVNDLTSKSLRDVLVVNASRKSALHTDELNAYDEPGREFAGHETVNHSAKQYSRRGKKGETVTTNTVEGYFSIFKRGMRRQSAKAARRRSTSGWSTRSSCRR